MSPAAINWDAVFREGTCELRDWSDALGTGFPPCRRLREALADGASGEGDLVSLVRQVLRCEEAARGHKVVLRMPVEATDRVDGSFWESADLDCVIDGTACAAVSLRDWIPAWAIDASVPPDVLPGNAPPLRLHSELSPDPCVSLVPGVSSYWSQAQREAVRTVLISEPECVVTVLLPTGAGKTLCMAIPALMRSPADGSLGVSPVIVPTVSLQLDLARRLEPAVGHGVAFDSNSPEACAEILDRCRAGEQGPVVISPESFMYSLLPVLLNEIPGGGLRNFIIDEAHMVLNWGEEFRPEFSQLANAHRRLRESEVLGGFRTILLSATMTDYHLRSLRRFFAPEGTPFRVCHCAALRPEPVYWHHRISYPGMRFGAVTEALFHVPRPALVYTTSRDCCQRLYKHLQEHGFSRMAMFHGETPPKERRKTLSKWIHDEVDVVVATSAFGLGVDKRDVRTVIHAELPESLDRLYQEVGRGGRDGHPAVALLIYHDSDWAAVDALSHPRLIGIEKAQERWHRMWSARTPTQASGIFSLPLDVGRELDMVSAKNEHWNLLTLRLMERARLIDTGRRHRSRSGYTMDVKVIGGALGSDVAWQTVDELRADITKAYSTGADLLRRFVESDNCASLALRDCYRSQAFGVLPALACGGCPACRRGGKPVTYPGRLIPRGWPAVPAPPNACAPRLSRLVGTSAVVLVFYAPGEIRPGHYSRLESLLPEMFEAGMVSVLCSESLSTWLFSSFPRWQLGVPLLWQSRLPHGISSKQPLLAIVETGLEDWWHDLPLDQSECLPTPTVLLLPDGIGNPRLPGRQLRDTTTFPVYSLRTWEDQYLE